MLHVVVAASCQKMVAAGPTQSDLRERMKHFSAHPFAAVTSATTNWQLIAQLTARDIAARYRGSIAGILWSLLSPLLSLAMYTFVFGFVFQARWGNGQDSTLDYALALFAGLVVHGLFAEVLGRAPFLVIGNPTYVKQILFPLETLPIVTLLSAVFNTIVGFSLLLIFWALSHDGLHIATFIIPILLVPLCLFALGVGWMLAATTVFFRDIAQLVSFISSGLLFLSPIFYPISAVPETLRPVLNLNPLTFIIESIRAVLLSGQPPHLIHFMVYSLVSLVVAALGFAWFQRLRPGFGDVL